MVCEYEFDEDSKTITVNCMGCVYGSSLADYEMCMLTTIDKLMQNLNTQSVVLRRNREYEYDYDQVKKLLEIARAIKTITRDKRMLSRTRVAFEKCEKWLSDDFADIEEIIMEDLRKDPVGAYVKLRRNKRKLKATIPEYPTGEKCYRQFLNNILIPVEQVLENLELIKSVKGMLSGYHAGDRDIYREIFHPTIRPNFMLTKYMSRPPEKGEVIDRYSVPGNIEIEVYNVPGKLRYVYHVTPPEFRLNEDNYTILDAARRYMAAHKPRAAEFTQPERMREVFSNIGRDMITDLGDHMGVSLSKDKLEELTSILTRYTAGLGILEIMLADKKVEDIYINSPVGLKPAFIRHSDYGECETNLIPTQEDAEAWATRFRMTSGRPLDEANPVLDTETDAPGGRARVSIITRTLSPEGLGFALRRHRDKPWTYPLYLQPNIKFFNPLFAGLMSFIIDGARTFLMAGTRSSGKCVTGDTLIPLPNGELKPIKDIVEEIFEKEAKQKVEDGYISHPSNLTVLTKAENLKIKPKRVSTVWKRKAPKKLIKIKTTSGKKIKTTKEHPYFVLHGKIEEKRADQLEVEEKIACENNKKLVWDEIIEVEEIESNEDWVYDFSIPRTQNFVANGIIAHNTSLLGASMLEIMRKYRIVSCEDSVTGDSRILIRRNGKFEKTTVGELINGLIEENNINKKFDRELIRAQDIKDNIEIFSIDEKGKGSFKKVSSFIRHQTAKQIYEVETSTGRKLKVTGDHSLFGIGKKNLEDLKTRPSNLKTPCFQELKVKNLEEGMYIAVPRRYKINNGRKDSINLLDHLDKLSEFYLAGEEVRKLIVENWEKIKEIKERLGYSRTVHSRWKRESILPIKILKEMETTALDPEKFWVKPSHGQAIPAKINLDANFLTLVGLWIADGCYDNRSILFSVVEPELREVVRKIAEKMGLNITQHSDTFTLMINSALLKRVMKDVLGLKGNSYTKEIPDWVYNLSKKQIAKVLKGIFSGDGCVSKKEIVIPLSSDKLLHDLQTLLLNYDVILRRSNDRKEDGTFNANISALKSQRAFKKWIDILIEEKKEKLEKLCSKLSTHDTSDIVPLTIETKKELSEIYSEFNTHDYIVRKNNIGREHLKKIVSDLPDESNLANPLKQLANSDILWDKVVRVEKVNSEEYVYDFSVPGNENFVCENILAHNTLELPIRRMRQLGFNVERMKSRSVITRVETELPAEEAIRTALRLGDSSLIVGEVRSTEARALYEAMRVGALANTVAGTIHGESPYGVFDRVVNDLGVPPTSFKATDFVIVCNTLKGAGGLHTYRRVTDVTEVRKHWEEDPSQEGGFVNLMKYSAKEDELQPTETFLNGESKILNDIASNVKEWAGDWGAVWENINLRGKVKKAIVDYSLKSGKKELLEAPFVVKANNKFHLISSKLREEVGAIPADRAYEMYENWLKDQIKTGKWREYK